MIYLDSSALVKLVVEERESVALEEWLASSADSPWTCSEIGPLEVVRAVRHLSPAAVGAARQVCGRCDLVSLTADTLRAAQEIGPPLLRSLDALHLASAARLGSDLSVFVSYDRRLLGAARDAGLTTVAPGLEPG